MARFSNWNHCNVSQSEMTDRIREKARSLWEERGCIEGKDLEIRREAERMVKGMSGCFPTQQSWSEMGF